MKPRPKYVEKGKVREENESKKDSKEQKKSKYVQKKLQVPQGLSAKTSSSDSGCIICSESVRGRDYIWSCSCCRVSMHLSCIKNWIVNVNRDKGKQSIYNWSCPQCKYEYNEALPKYYCYCGKYLNPEAEGSLPPHSCGRRCERQRGQYCPHPCPIMCHAGRCPPCEYPGVQETCHCGTATRLAKCSDQRLTFHCGKKCSRPLNCGKHHCEKNCHPADCQPCKKKHLVTCYCSKSQEVVDCMQLTFACIQPCGKVLECGIHRCEKKCHEGECSQCPRDPKTHKTCSCGQYTVEMLTGNANYREKCADPIPSCGMPCKKTLMCGHKCVATCHDSPCPDCKQTAQQSCDCGLQKRKIVCWRKSQEQFKCENICKKRKMCANHTCYVQCCPARASLLASNHPCEVICSKMLNCNQHECGEPCHLGLCKKCPVVYSQSRACPCGATRMRPPILCGTEVPQCGNPCAKEMACGHKCEMICHYGPCVCYEEVKVLCQCGREPIATRCGREALCMTKCSKTLYCGHKCGVQCHKGECTAAKKTPCNANCNKVREECGHRCGQLCHLPKPCGDYSCETNIVVKCDCGHRQTSYLCGAKKGSVKIQCNAKCNNLKRFDTLYKNRHVYYSDAMVEFASKNLGYLAHLQTRLENFILHGEESVMEIEIKFNNAQSKNVVHSLLENNYHLSTHFYKHRTYSCFTVMQSDATIVPKPSLSAYYATVIKDKPEQKCPFQITVWFDVGTEKVENILSSIKEFIHMYYLEKKDRLTYLHFWETAAGEEVLGVLTQRFQTVNFRANINDSKNNVPISPSEVIQLESSQQNHQEQQRQLQSNQQQKKSKGIEIPSFPSSKKQFKRDVKEQSKEYKQGKQLSKSSKKLFECPPSNLIMRNRPIVFRMNDYPSASEFAPQIYHIDEDEMFCKALDYPQVMRNLISKVIGPEAGEWRIRALLILCCSLDKEGRVHEVSEGEWYKLFTNALRMYEKDKAHTRRILQIQRLDSKSVQREMQENGVYLSDHEPEIISYLCLWNYLAIDKILYEETEPLLATMEYARAINIVNAVATADAATFFEVWTHADYLFACAMLPLLHVLRDNVVQLIRKQRKVSTLQGKLHSCLLFANQKEFVQYCCKRGIIIKTKEKGKEISYYVESDCEEDKIQQDYRIYKELYEKRNKKYFLHEVTEYVKEVYMTRSFFAFGEFKEEINPTYVIALVRSLRNSQRY